MTSAGLSALEILLKISNIASVKTIVFQPVAARAWDKLPIDARGMLEAALTIYATTGIGDTKAMTGTLTVCQRVGDYRIIFDETATTIRILVVGHRREIYR